MVHLQIPLPLPGVDEIERWTGLENTLGRSFSAIGVQCNLEESLHPAQCTYMRKLHHCLEGARMGGARPGFTFHSGLVEWCSRKRVCDLFSNNPVGSGRYSAHHFWCTATNAKERGVSQVYRPVSNSTPGGTGQTFLTFETCGGLTNQRIALIQAFMLARLTSSKAVLPRLNPNGAPARRSSRYFPRSRGTLRYGAHGYMLCCRDSTCKQCARPSTIIYIINE